MALIQCPECGKDVSDKSEKCIHCGYPIANTAEKPSPGGTKDDAIEMQERVCKDNPTYNPSQRTNPGQRNRKPNIATIIVVVAIIAIANFTVLGNGFGGKLNGEYIAQTALSDNLINFSGNGGFARFARTFGDWELVTGGKYTLNGNSLTLKCSDGQIWEFYYDRANDTLQQKGINITFRRYYS